jgi:hypothetical protein
MITYFVVTATTTPGIPVFGPPCPSIEKALCGAKSLLGDGAVTAYVADSDGNLILPADQVRTRLKLSDSASRHVPV